MPARSLRVLAAALPSALAALPCQQPVTFDSLLGEMVDLDRLARWPDPDYRTVQFGSSDRRTRGPEDPDWFVNADGFGQEPVPNFERVLQQPGADGVGEFLVCDVEGPGAIVRGWSAGMQGRLRVYLDGDETPRFEGTGHDFFARRSTRLIPGFAGLPPHVRELFVQQDADYLPVPFGQRLRIAWRGTLRELHFYQIQVRRYANGTRVETSAGQALTPAQVARLAGWTDRDPAAFGAGAEPFALGPDAAWSGAAAEGPGLLRLLSVRVEADDVQAALRGTLLRIAFDGSQRPQVEAPLGDFFGSGPGIHPTRSLPVHVGADGMLLCRWPMPYRRSCRIELVNWSGAPVRGTVLRLHAPLPGGFDERTLQFHAKWRVDHALHARGSAAPIDVPYLTAIGQGRLVGLACQILNPPMQASWRSNWWGEGDEKIFVDGALTTLGTGSEDYFNYSWSHWNLFAHPYCGQPLASGPGNCGYVSNHRFQILDDLPFAHSLAASMELWSHQPVTPLSYGRIAYWYARPGSIDDHRAPQPSELRLPELQPWDQAALAGDERAQSFPLHGHECTASAGAVRSEPTRLSRSRSLLAWTAPAGASLSWPFEVPQDGTYRLRLLCLHRPEGTRVQCRVDDGEPLRIGGRDTFALHAPEPHRLLDLLFDGVRLSRGGHRLTVTCPDGGHCELDLFGWELQPPPPLRIAGALEGELLDLVARSEGVVVEVQHLGAQWSGGHQRWIKAGGPGDSVTFRVVPDKPGRYRVTLRLTTSRDFGIVRVLLDGAEAARDVDLYTARPGLRELDLGERELSGPVELRLQLTGANPESRPPRSCFGLDCVVLAPR
jgi:hypothetical protein